MRKPVLAYIPAAASNNAVHAAHPLGTILSTTRASKATRVNKDGLIEEIPSGMPRQDWSDGNCPSLLLEPERTNLVIKSETLTDTGNATTGWSRATYGSGTISVDSGFASPTGELNAYKFSVNGVATGNNGVVYTHDDYLGTRFINAGDYSVSVWLKGEAGGEIVPVDFKSRTSSGETGDEFTLTTEWKRYTVTVNKASASNTSGGFQFRFYNRSDISDQVFYAFGCQIEQASYSSSYIKADSGSTVTRVKDSATSWGNSSMFDVTEGSFFVDATHFNNPLNGYCQITISNGGSNFIRNIYENGRVRTTAWLGVAQFDYFDTDADENQRNKILFTFKENEFKLYRAGQLVATDSSGVIPTGLSRLDFANQSGTIRHFEGKVHDIRFYDYVLSEAEAIKLTS